MEGKIGWKAWRHWLLSGLFLSWGMGKAICRSVSSVYHLDWASWLRSGMGRHGGQSTMFATAQTAEHLWEVVSMVQPSKAHWYPGWRLAAWIDVYQAGKQDVRIGLLQPVGLIGGNACCHDPSFRDYERDWPLRNGSETPGPEKDTLRWMSSGIPLERLPIRVPGSARLQRSKTLNWALRTTKSLHCFPWF